MQFRFTAVGYKVAHFNEVWKGAAGHRQHEKADANRRCAEEHWWKQLCSKALARGTNKGVFVITTGKAEALKFTNLGTAPCSLPVSVEDMGPNGLGDAQINDDDIVLLFNGHNHYNGLVSASITEALS